MGKDTRQMILATAKRMFGERGYNAVSMGDIANALGISKGNLTYHFKKKEDIVWALLSQNSLCGDPKMPSTLEELNADFRHMQTVIEDNAFYFWHHAQLAQLSPQIKDLQNRAVARQRQRLEEALGTLEEKGLLDLSRCSSKAQLVNALLLTTIYWLPFSDLAGGSTCSFLQQMWSNLLPHLTPQGESEYRAAVDASENGKTQ